MATIVLSAAGAAAGSAVGGSVLGLSSVVIGRAVGATLGRVIDQRVMGSGSSAVETGRVERFRVAGASEGAPISQVYGRTRLAGQVIWASRFKETRTTTGGGGGGGGKGGGAPEPAEPKVTEYSYSVSLAIALCEGEILRVGRVWADGNEIRPGVLNWRVYTGGADQLPDPKMEAVEGSGNVPAYRGLAYVLVEDLQLGQFGNRVPQLSFEVFREAKTEIEEVQSLQSLVQGVALIPGTGEYALATTRVNYSSGQGKNQSANVNTPRRVTDFRTSLSALNGELPNCGSTLLVASWFGDDLRCGACDIKPKVEQRNFDGKQMPWNVSGLARSGADVIPRIDDKAVYGGTPADASVIEGIEALKAAGKAVVFYPFILMDQLEGNFLPDPYTASFGQSALPWRGRITTSFAPGVAGSPDGTAAAEAEVSTFFGSAAPGHFGYSNGVVTYSGPNEWSYRRFILHYARLCKAAGGVDAFCIGSEMRGLTQIRGAGNSFPAVDALRALAADVRSILGAGTKISYAADWSEYFGYQPQDGSGDVFFHLDPLWGDPEIDFIGIDNYMPVADWRDGDEHADADWGSIYSQAYLKANIEGGEGYDWYYSSPEAEAAQIRTPIEDGAYGEPWVFRYKDMRSWWENAHYNRVGGVRAGVPTAWVPQSKPFWFTEYGCAAVDKGANQPNKFLDPKSSESSLPKYSNGTRDDLMQAQYLRAVTSYWGDAGNNPVSEVYDGPMIDMARAHAWAWDTRPFPYFPANRTLWGDAENYGRGHWLNGRVSSQALGAVVDEICGRSGVADVDVSHLYGLVHGYSVDDIDGARSALQPLLVAYGVEAIERDGKLVFQNRTGKPSEIVTPDVTVAQDGQASGVETIRAPDAETAGRVRLTYVEASGDYRAQAAESIFPDEESRNVAETEFPLVMTSAEAKATTDRWLIEARVARDRARFALPMSRLDIGAGDVVELDTADGTGLYRIDRIEQGEARVIEGVRTEGGVYAPSDAVEEPVSLTPFVPPSPVFPLFMDLPLLTGDEVPHAPHIAISAEPWPGSVAVYSAPQDSGYELNKSIFVPSITGITETALSAAQPGVWDRGAALRVVLADGELASRDMVDVLNGANAAAIGDGSSGTWEIFQFADAQLVDTDTYELSLRLRGQLGSDGLMPAEWPVGSQFVLLDGAPVQINLAQSARDLARHYRIGPAGLPIDDESYVYLVEPFKGNGLRPYAPAHLRAARGNTGDLDISWTRRTRIDGDSWASVEVPLGEDTESYLVRVRSSTNAILREFTVAGPTLTYPAFLQASDGAVAPFVIEVAQVSDRYGAGLFKRLDVTA